MLRWLNKYLFVISLSVAVPVLLVSGGCAAVSAVFDKGLVITGESLNTMGQVFVATGNAMNRSLDVGQVTKEQYNSWRTFAVGFKENYPKAVSAWKEAVKVNDVTKQESAAKIISDLSVELAQYLAMTLPH